MANSNNFDLKISFSADLGNTSVVFRNVHSELTSSFGNLQGTIASSGNAIRSNMQQTGETAKAHADTHKQANDKIVKSTDTMANQLKNGFEGIQSAFGKLGMGLAAIGTLIGGGNWLGGMITKTQESGKEIEKLSRMLNVSLKDASVYKEALEDIGVESDVLVRASRLLVKQISGDGKVFQQYGISIKDANGQFKSTDKILFDVIDKYRELGNTVEATAFGTRVFSRSFSEIQPMVRLHAKALQEARQRTEEFNLVLTTDQLKALKDYKKSQEDANDVLEEFGKTITFYIMPIMQEFMKGLEANRDVFNALAELIRGFMFFMITFGKMLAQIFYLIQYGWKETYEIWEYGTKVMSLSMGLLLSAVSSDVKGIILAMGDLKKATKDFTESRAKSIDDYVKKAGDSAKGYLAMLEAMVDSEMTLRRDGEEAKLPKSGSPRTAEEEVKAKMQSMAIKEAEIMKQTIGNLELRNQMLLALYTKYFQALGAKEFESVDVATQAQTDLTNKITSLTEQRTKAEMDLLDTYYKYELDLFDQQTDEKERQAQREYSLGEITQNQLTDKLTQILNMRLMAYRSHYAILRALHKSDSDYVTRLKQEETLKINQLEKQRVILAEKQNDILKANNKKMKNDMVNAFESGFKGMLAGTKSFAEGMRSIFDGLMNLVDEIIWSMVREWILGEEAKTAASTFGFGIIATLTEGFHALMSALGWESTAEKVAQEETKGTASIWGEWGAYPPIAIALTAGLIGILAGLAFSAKGGWDSVPFDGAMTELHKGEMVLPQHLAEKVRNMAEPQPSQNITYNIQALDAQSFKAFASKNKGILFNTHNSALRDGLQYGVRGV